MYHSQGDFSVTNTFTSASVFLQDFEYRLSTNSTSADALKITVLASYAFLMTCFRVKVSVNMHSGSTVKCNL